MLNRKVKILHANARIKESIALRTSFIILSGGQNTKLPLFRLLSAFFHILSKQGAFRMVGGRSARILFGGMRKIVFAIQIC